MTLSIEQLQSVIDTCEFDRWMGVRIESLDAATLTVRMPFRTEMGGTPKVARLHGGVISSLIDAAGCYLLIANINKRVSTINLTVDFLRPGYGDLTAVARIVKIGRQICNVAVEVTGADGKLAATGRLTIVPSAVEIGNEEQLAAEFAARGRGEAC